MTIGASRDAAARLRCDPHSRTADSWASPLWTRSVGPAPSSFLPAIPLQRSIPSSRGDTAAPGAAGRLERRDSGPPLPAVDHLHLAWQISWDVLRILALGAVAIGCSTKRSSSSPH